MVSRAFVACLALTVACLALAPAAGAKTSCKENTPIAATGELPEKAKAKARAKVRAITLTPDPATEVVNFGPWRGNKEIDIVLNASDALPKWFTAEHLEVDIPRRLRRVGENLESVTGSLPKLTKPRIGGRKRVSFTVCIDGSELPAGRYTSLLMVDGPAGMESAAVTITANAKNGELWWIGFISALAIAFVLLLYRDASARVTKTGKWRWFKALWRTLLDPPWWAATIVSVGAAFGTIYAIYAGNPAWGEDGPAAVFALIGATLTAAGVQSFLASLRNSGEDEV